MMFPAHLYLNRNMKGGRNGHFVLMKKIAEDLNKIRGWKWSFLVAYYALLPADFLSGDSKALSWKSNESGLGIYQNMKPFYFLCPSSWLYRDLSTSEAESITVARTSGENIYLR